MSFQVGYGVDVDSKSFAQKLIPVLFHLQHLTLCSDTFLGTEPADGMRLLMSIDLPVWKLTQLWSLHLGTSRAIEVTRDKILALVSFSHLRSLELVIQQINEESSSPATKLYLPLTLRSLDTLILKGSLEDAMAFFSVIACPCLETMRFIVGKTNWNQPASDSDGYPMLVDLISLFASNILRVLDLYLEDSPSFFSQSSQRSGKRSMWDVLWPLIPCDRLERLKVRLPQFLNLEEKHLPLYDDKLEKLFKAWPDLIELMINVGDIRDVDARAPLPPTFRTIAAFAQFHPRLTHLRLPYMCIPSDMVTDRSNGMVAKAVLSLDSLPVLDHDLKFFYFHFLGIRDVYPPSASERGDGSRRRPPWYWRMVRVPVMEFALMLDRVLPFIEGHAYVHRNEQGKPDATSYESSVLQILEGMQAGRKNAHRVRVTS